VDLVIIPGVDHSFQPVFGDPLSRVWDRLTLATMARPVSPLALRAISTWATRVLCARDAHAAPGQTAT
jgi:hypothetical protein